MDTSDPVRAFGGFPEMPRQTCLRAREMGVTGVMPLAILGGENAEKAGSAGSLVSKYNSFADTGRSERFPQDIRAGLRLPEFLMPGRGSQTSGRSQIRTS